MFISQLELRILAHLANCKSMLDAFRAGGDFHSRTAMNMYPYIREAIDKKQVLLEWHPQPGEDKPPVPLLKVNCKCVISDLAIVNCTLAACSSRYESTSKQQKQSEGILIVELFACLPLIVGREICLSSSFHM